VVAAGVVGATALYHSTDGKNAAGPSRPVRSLPSTPNLLVGVVDERGELASVAVFTNAPGRPGGSIVSIPTNAAMTADGQQVSLASQFDGKTASLNTATGAVLGVSFDNVMRVDEEELAGLLPDVGELEVDLPADVVDGVGVSGRIQFPHGEQTMTREDAAAALAARAGDVVTGANPPTADENDVAVWRAVVEAIGEGVEGTVELAESVRPAQAKVVRSLYSGAVKARGLRVHRIEGGDKHLVGVDRSDVLIVFGQISPRQVAAPAASINIRLVARFPAGSIKDGSIADVAATAIDRLIVVQTNVVSVSTGEGDAPAVTRLEVVTTGNEQLAEDVGTQLFGDATVVTTDYELRGVDLIVTLGESFLRELDEIGQTGD
jgi:hypothetical protein